MRRIIWFTQEMETCYREISVFGKMKLPEEFPKIQLIKQDDLQIYVCIFPQYYKKRKSRIGTHKTSPYVEWNAGALLQLMQKTCVELGADTYFVSEEFGKGILPEKTIQCMGGQRMDINIWKHILQRIKTADMVVYLSGERMDSAYEQLPERLWFPVSFLRKVHHFYGILSEHDDDTMISSLEDHLWQQYGMPLVRISDWSEYERLNKDEEVGRILVIDDRMGNQMADQIVSQAIDQVVGKKEDWQKDDWIATSKNVYDTGKDIWGQKAWTKWAKRIYYVDMWSVHERCLRITGADSSVRYYSEYEYIRAAVKAAENAKSAISAENAKPAFSTGDAKAPVS
ncbi:MAG: hypothetical protein ACI4FV_01330 [Lachnospiraceae bacterium]